MYLEESVGAGFSQSLLDTPLMLLSSHEKEKTFTLPLFFFGKPLLTIVLAVSEKMHIMPM